MEGALQQSADLLLAGPDVSEEKAERAKKKEMVLEQVEEERERRVNQGKKSRVMCIKCFFSRKWLIRRNRVVIRDNV